MDLIDYSMQLPQQPQPNPEKVALEAVFTAFDKMKVELKIDPDTIGKKGVLSLVAMLMRNGDKVAGICGPAFDALNKLYKAQDRSNINPK